MAALASIAISNPRNLEVLERKDDTLTCMAGSPFNEHTRRGTDGIRYDGDVGAALPQKACVLGGRVRTPTAPSRNGNASVMGGINRN